MGMDRIVRTFEAVGQAAGKVNGGRPYLEIIKAQADRLKALETEIATERPLAILIHDPIQRVWQGPDGAA